MYFDLLSVKQTYVRFMYCDILSVKQTSVSFMFCDIQSLKQTSVRFTYCNIPLVKQTNVTFMYFDSLSGKETSVRFAYCGTLLRQSAFHLSSICYCIYHSSACSRMLVIVLGPYLQEELFSGRTVQVWQVDFHIYDGLKLSLM